MNKIATTIIILAAALAGVLYFKGGTAANMNPGSGANATSTGSQGENSVSTGLIRWSYPDSFGLAVTNEQLRGMVSSYIPPCDQDFDYCLYYKGREFANTNFESAGLRIKKRADLANERLCLDTPPAGRANMGNSTTSADNYSASIFSPLSDAAAGHYANGELYRVYLRRANMCYELETRIGETQIANYPPGTKVQFSESDRNKIYDGFRSILGSLKIASTSEAIKLPESED